MVKRIVLLAWSGCVAWAVAIFGLSCLSGQQVGEWMPPVWNFDKLCHFVAFAAGGIVVAYALRWTWNFKTLPLGLISVGIVSFYGATDEWHQLSTPGRSGADVGDWIADTLGGAAGAFFVAIYYVRTLSTGSRSPGATTPARDQRA